MFARIVVRDMRQAGGDMRLRGSERDFTAGVVLGKGLRERSPAPRPAEIESVQMRDLAVGSIADRGGFEQRRRAARFEAKLLPI